MRTVNCLCKPYIHEEIEYATNNHLLKSAGKNRSQGCLSGERTAAHPVMDGAKVSSAARKIYKVYSHVGRAPKWLANEAND